MKSYENESMLNMIFENRNKSYGAYQLRLDYSQRISRAMLIMLSFLICLGIGKTLSGSKRSVSVIEPTVIADLTNIEQIRPKEETGTIEPPKPPQTTEAAGRSTIRNTEMRVIENDEQASDSIPTVEQMRDIDPGITTNLTANTMGITDGRGTAQTFDANHDSEVSNIPDFVFTPEVMPIYPGGEEALLKFIFDNTRYPEMERELGVEGKAFIKFVVDNNGKVTKAEIMRSDSRGFGNEGIRVISMLKKFTPGMQQGKPVKVQMVLPFTFRMN